MNLDEQDLDRLLDFLREGKIKTYEEMKQESNVKIEDREAYARKVLTEVVSRYVGHEKLKKLVMLDGRSLPLFYTEEQTGGLSYLFQLGVSGELEQVRQKQGGVGEPKKVSVDKAVNEYMGFSSYVGDLNKDIRVIETWVNDGIVGNISTYCASIDQRMRKMKRQ